MGTYICEAFNGVPNNATQEFQIHVYCELKNHFALCALGQQESRFFHSIDLKHFFISFSNHLGGGASGGGLSGLFDKTDKKN